MSSIQYKKTAVFCTRGGVGHFSQRNIESPFLIQNVVRFGGVGNIKANQILMDVLFFASLTDHLSTALFALGSGGFKIGCKMRTHNKDLTPGP